MSVALTYVVSYIVIPNIRATRNMGQLSTVIRRHPCRRDIPEMVKVYLDQPRPVRSRHVVARGRGTLKILSGLWRGLFAYWEAWRSGSLAIA